ncbi:aldo/keto reductase [Candidimonas nitroreducens]|uniref:Aldo/keto reductase n=1 Tax=Candidimonas nitroreducens TaxID=683354 RepID=A0A225M7Q3_9BURK|nr:aldo/keto reductase [Candidimonas nitroreducens]OWT56752.1 aldo/keto reductase [Candidimonas nitroreducens]
MEMRLLGGSGLEVSAIGMGCNSFGTKLDGAGVREVVHCALDLGVTLFDTANIYGAGGGSETLLGAALGARRQQAVLATKVGMPMSPRRNGPDNSRKEIMREVEASLKRLGTSWIDLYQIHYPDSHTPVEETLRALDDLVRQGKVRYIGCGNFSGDQLLQAADCSRQEQCSRFIACQAEYNFLSRECETALVPAALQSGVSIMPYFPLATGMLSGSIVPGRPLPARSRLAKDPGVRERFWTIRNQKLLAGLFDAARLMARRVPDLSLAWLLSRPGVTCVIAGATNVAQVQDNAAAAQRPLSSDDLALLDSVWRSVGPPLTPA